MSRSDVTDEQIEGLRAEAGQAGDEQQIAICLIALGIDPAEWAEHHGREPLPDVSMSRADARAECARVLGSTAEAGITDDLLSLDNDATTTTVADMTDDECERAVRVLEGQRSDLCDVADGAATDRAALTAICAEHIRRHGAHLVIG